MFSTMVHILSQKLIVWMTLTHHEFTSQFIVLRPCCEDRERKQRNNRTEYNNKTIARTGKGKIIGTSRKNQKKLSRNLAKT